MQKWILFITWIQNIHLILASSSIHYKLEPGSYKPFDKNSIITPDIVEAEQALESGVYFTHRYSPNNKLSFSSGIRYSLFNYLGPQNGKLLCAGFACNPG